jgi:hypothetical protein
MALATTIRSTTRVSSAPPMPASMEAGTEIDTLGSSTVPERNRVRLRPAIVRHADWKAAILTALEWRSAVAAGAVGAS